MILKMLQNAHYLLAIIGFDTAENEPAKTLQNLIFADNVSLFSPRPSRPARAQRAGWRGTSAWRSPRGSASPSPRPARRPAAPPARRWRQQGLRQEKKAAENSIQEQRIVQFGCTKKQTLSIHFIHVSLIQPKIDFSSWSRHFNCLLLFTITKCWGYPDLGMRKQVRSRRAVNESL